MSDKNGIFKGVEVDRSIENNVIFRIDLKESESRIENFLIEQLAIVFVRLPDNGMSIANNINRLICPKVV